MNILIKGTAAPMAVTLINPTTKENIAEKFIDKWEKKGYEKAIEKVGGAWVLNSSSYSLLVATLEQEQINLDRFVQHGIAANKHVNMNIELEFDCAISNEVTNTKSFMQGLKKGVERKAKIIDRLVDGQVVVKNPVNKKFWPLVNTSHTFKITHFEETKLVGGQPAYKIHAECEFTILMADSDADIEFLARVELLMGIRHKNLVVIEERHFLPINFLREEEAEVLEVLHDGIHRDFAMRGILKEAAA